MIQITIPHKGKFNLVTEWEEITLKTGNEVAKVVALFPPEWVKAQQFRLAGNEAKALELEIEIKNKYPDNKLTKIFTKVIELLSNIPKAAIHGFTKYDINFIIESVLYDIILGFAIAPYSYQKRDITHFEHDGIKYYLPTYKKLIGKKIPMSNTTAQEFSEAMDLMAEAAKEKGHYLDNMAYVIAILCRPKYEEYNEDKCLKRAESFLDLPITDVWEVFFCLQKLLNTLKKPELRSLKNHQLKIEELEANTDGMQP